MPNFVVSLIGVVCGGIAYYLVYTFVIWLGLDTDLLKCMGIWTSNYGEAIRLPRPTDIKIENKTEKFTLCQSTNNSVNTLLSSLLDSGKYLYCHDCFLLACEK